jgi:hypothetical protein
MNRSELQTEIETIINGGQNTALVVREALAKIADESYLVTETITFSTSGINGNAKFLRKGDEVLLQGQFTNTTTSLFGFPIIFQLPDAFLPKDQLVSAVAFDGFGNSKRVVIYNDNPANNLGRKKLILSSNIASNETIYFNFSYQI